jgi:hypothetical protein
LAMYYGRGRLRAMEVVYHPRHCVQNSSVMLPFSLP